MAALAEMLWAKARICDIASAVILLVYWNNETALRDRNQGRAREREVQGLRAEEEIHEMNSRTTVVGDEEEEQGGGKRCLR